MTKFTKTSLLAILLSASFYCFSFYFIDKPIAYAFHDHPPTGLYYTVYHLVTLLGDAKLAACFVVFSLVSAVVILIRNPQSRLANNLLLIGIAMSAAIFAETFLKYFFGRYRPEMLFTQGLYGFHYFSHEFLLNSTPSGHATRVFVFVAGCSMIWKRLATFFVLIGMLVCLSRLALEFHFLSDVVFGAALGTLVTLWTSKVYHSIIISSPTLTPLKPRF